MRHAPSFSLALLLFVIFALQATLAQSVTEPVAEAPGENKAVAATTDDDSAPTIGEAHENLNATLWMQTSSEYRATCLQTYRSAIRQLGDALVHAKTSAALEQGSDVDQLPPAVILDVDETVLDNSGYQAHLIDTGGQYSPDDWAAWTANSPSPPVPGAKEFLNACKAAGVTPFFVTNRANEVKAATRTNLEKYDMIPRLTEGQVDTLLCKYDEETWTSDKTTRRAHLAQSYRILLLLGDDLNDFVSVGIKPTPAARCALMEQHQDRFGKQWFMLPNPTYGGWDRAVHGWRDASSRETKVTIKREALRLDPPAEE
jgi:acid phosphatase